MIKVLLVDDDSLLIEGLRELVMWSELDMEVVGWAYDGQSALEIAACKDPDIIIADIAMPVMSGLEFGRRVKELLPEVLLIFLSAHEDFNYARQALEMRANDYLVKPVNYRELTEKLKEYTIRVTERRNREKQIKNSKKHLRDELLRLWMNGEIEEASVDSLLKENGSFINSFDARVAVIEFDDIELKLNKYSESEREKILHNARKVIYESLERIGIHYYFKTDKGHIALIIEKDDSFLFETLREIIEDIKETEGISVTVGIGERVKSWDKVHESYAQAQKALSIKMFSGKGRLISYDPSELKREEKKDSDIKKILEQLFEAIRDYNYEELHNQLEQLFYLIKGTKDKDTVYQTVFHLVSSLNEFLHSFNEDFFELLGLELQDLNVIHKFETIEDVKNWVGSLLDRISKILNEKRQSRKSVIIENIQKYVSDHIEENITLKEIADYFAISPNYLGFLFKEETGENFSNYLSRMRMYKVGELLNDPSLKVYEIADRLGYKNMTYFNAKFKEYFNTSPRDYRKQRR